PNAAGTLTGTVILADSTPVGTHSFTVTGTGVAQTATLSMDPPSLLFADLAVGATSGNLTIQVTNTGDSNVTFDRVFSTGDFRLSLIGCSILRVGSTCNINVQFAPIAAGTLTGTIVFEDNATGSPQSVTLSGTG